MIFLPIDLKTRVLGAQNNRFIVMVLLNTQNICFSLDITQILFHSYPEAWP